MKFNVNSLSVNDFVEALCHLSGEIFSIHLKLPKKKEDFIRIYNTVQELSYNDKARDDWKNGTGFFGDCEYLEIKEQGSAKRILQNLSNEYFFGFVKYAYIDDEDFEGLSIGEEHFKFGISDIERCVFTTDGYTNWFLSDYNINRNWFKLINGKGYIENFGRLQIFQYLSDKTNGFDSGMCEALLYDIKQYHQTLIEKREEVLPEIFKRFTFLRGFGSVSVSFSDTELYYAIETLEQKLNSVESPKGISIKDKYELPAELDNDKARWYFAKAVKAGLMSEQFEWQKSNVLLACFCREMSIKLDLGKSYNSNGSKQICWKPFEILFNIKRGGLREHYNNIQKTGEEPREINIINNIFN